MFFDLKSLGPLKIFKLEAAHIQALQYQYMSVCQNPFKWTKYWRSVSRESFTRGKINGSTAAEKDRRNRAGKKGQAELEK
jgi:hypothetical protein